MPSSSTEAKNAWSYGTTPPYAAISCRGVILRCSRVTEGEHSTSNVLHRNSRHDPAPVSFNFLSPHLFSKNATGCFMAHKLSMKFERTVKRVRKKIRVKTRKITMLNTQAKPDESRQNAEQELGRTFIHSVICLTTGSKLPPKRFLHTVQSRASSFK